MVVRHRWERFDVQRLPASGPRWRRRPGQLVIWKRCANCGLVYNEVPPDQPMPSCTAKPVPKCEVVDGPRGISVLPLPEARRRKPVQRDYCWLKKHAPPGWSLDGRTRSARRLKADLGS